ncbi:MAG: YihY family inner membrane protein [Kiloniellaceae bacterium]
MKKPDLPGFLRNLKRFVVYCWHRFQGDQCLKVATQLSYASLLAIVPILAICLGLLSAVPAFDDLRVDAQMMLFENLLPDAGIEVSDQVATFVQNARSGTGVGFIALVLTAILLLNTINGAFNAIWRVTEPRPLMIRVMAYWMVLTIGPILLGASLSLSSYGFATQVIEHGDRAFGLTRLLPFLLTVIGFTLVYLVVPARAVSPLHAFSGGVVGAVLFEVLKTGFAFYLKQFPSYQAIYGAMAAVPIFLVWMYLSWAVVLFGAEVAAASREWRLVDRLASGSRGAGSRLALALALLYRLRNAARSGTVLKETALTRSLPANLDQLSQVLDALKSGGFVSRSGGRWFLARDLTAASLDDLMGALHLTLDPGEGWPDGVEAIVTAAGKVGGDVKGKSLAALIDKATASEPPDGVARLHPTPQDER